MFDDLRYGIRSLLKNPGFTAVGVITLALGIGANTAIFTLIDAVLLKMLPVKNPEQLVLLNMIDGRGNRNNFSYPLYERLRDHNQAFSGMFASLGFNFQLAVDGKSESRLDGAIVSGSYFSVLGVSAFLGRTLTVEDDRVPGGHPVVVISYNFWKQRFALSTAIVGKAITLNGTPFTIIGVTPPEFLGHTTGELPKVWVPLMMQFQVRPGRSLLNDPNSSWLEVIARLRPEVSVEQARAGLNVLVRQYVAETVGEIKADDARHRREILNQKVELESGSQGLNRLRQRFSQSLLILMLAVGLVLLVACSNVANLLLVRATGRQKEIAVRIALGAGRLRLIRQLLTEGVLLATLGGVAGLLLSYWITDFVLALFSVSLDLSPNVRILGFTGAVCVLTGILSGLAPAFRATRVDLNSTLKDNSRSLIGGAPRLSLGRGLVISQIALSLLLLIGAGLFIRSLQRLKSLDAGFQQDNVLLSMIDPVAAGHKEERLTNTYIRLLEALSALPGVRSASLSQQTFRTGSSMTCCLSVEGYTPQPNEDRSVRTEVVSPKYFETMGIPLRLGRDFSWQDGENTPKVAVINESMAHYYFSNANPIGKRFGWGETKNSTEIEIVGVAKDAKYDSLREQTPHMIYFPFLQNAKYLWVLAVHTVGKPSDVAAAIRQEVKSVDPSLPVTNVATLAEQVDESLRPERLIAKLSGLFGLLGLLLAAVGLYGTMSYTVARRTNEIGIRMALGAQRGDVLWSVLKESLQLVMIGVVIGLPAALSATRLISSQLFGLTPNDPGTIAMATLLLVAVAAIAGYLPARKASRVDPMVALRYE